MFNIMTPGEPLITFVHFDRTIHLTPIAILGASIVLALEMSLQ
ncbi:MAG: hypothetical protein Q8O41_01455 [Candidatus Methanoperedens sp.]|nr:hypothetical protein [Candidatus Methanoperedens sp.]